MKKNINKSEEDINKHLEEIEALSGKLEANSESMVFVPLADAYRKSGMMEQAEEVCRLGLEKHPQFSSARVVLGRVFLEQKKYGEAVDEFRQVIKGEVDNLMANTLIGHALLGERRFKEAVEALRRALVLNPNDSELQSTLADAIDYSKGLKEPPPEEKIEEETTVEAGETEVVELIEETGGIVEEKAEDAAPAKVAGSADGGIAASLKVAETHMRLGEFGLAISIYEEVVAADPDNLIAHNKLREACARLDAAAEDSSPTSAAKEDISALSGDDAVVEPGAVVVERSGSGGEAVESKDGMLDLDLPFSDTARAERSAREEASEELVAEEVSDREEEEDAEIERELIAVADSAGGEVGKQEATTVASDDEPLAEETASTSGPEVVEDDLPETLMQSPGEGVDFTAVLASLNETAGIVGSMLVAPGDGSVFDQVLTIEMDTSEIGQMVSAIYNNVRKSANSLSQGKLTQVLITARDGQVFLNTTSYGILAILANEKIRIGMLRLALKEAVNDIEEIARKG